MRSIVLAILFTAACVSTDDDALPDGDVIDIDAAITSDVDAAIDGRDVDAPEQPDAAITSLVLGAHLFVGPDGAQSYAGVSISYQCPAGSAAGERRGAVELYYVGFGVARTETVTWTCEWGSVQITWFNLLCGYEVQARAVALDPLTDEPVYALSETLLTPCAP